MVSSLHFVSLALLRLGTDVKIFTNRLHNDLSVDLPNLMEMKESARRLNENRPNGDVLGNIFAFHDVVRLPCTYYVNIDVQNRYNVQYTDSVEVTSLVAFNF